MNVGDMPIHPRHLREELADLRAAVADLRAQMHAVQLQLLYSSRPPTTTLPSPTPSGPQPAPPYLGPPGVYMNGMNPHVAILDDLHQPCTQEHAK